jgi:Protein of unknown function (DUF1552)
MSFDLSRRTALRGMFNGAAVAVTLPFLDVFLDGNGQALASTSAPLPTRFGTWFWGLGCNPQRWFPSTTGKDYDLKVELEPIKPYRGKINVFGEFPVPLDGKPNFPHGSGIAAIRTGTAMSSGGVTIPAPSFDVLIGDAIGTQTRFRSIDIAVSGGTRNTLSGRGTGNMNPSETSPLALYTRLFGPGFQDPNSGTFTPDPKVMARRSVLSSVTEQRKQLEARLGTVDRQRLDQYLTSVRQLEKQLDVQLTKPEPLQACVLAKAPKERPLTTDVESVAESHQIFTQLLLMALACDQTRVFNLLFSDAGSLLTHIGTTTTFHQLTHEEPLDVQLGYQPSCTVFVNKIMHAWGEFVGMCDAVKEGDGTLLDHMLVFAHSDIGLAKFHTIDDVPIMTAGSASGRLKTGQYISGKGTPVSRLGLTMQQVMGLPIDKWGTGSLQTNKAISELVA